MIKVENIVTPSPENWKIVIRGMRNAFKATDRMDSEICEDSEEEKEICYKDCPYVDHWEGEAPSAVPICNYSTYDDGPVFVLGPRDKDRLIDLCQSGSSDRKLLRQLPIILDVNAPLYWWKQADKYQVGTVTNAESTMHTITKLPFEMDDFSIDALKEIDEPCKCGTYGNVFKAFIIDDLNVLRELCLKAKTKKEKELIKRAMFQLLPESYNQKRTWSLNYEVALNMTMQRYYHPLSEWHTLIQFFIDNLPYFKPILKAVGMTGTLETYGYKIES